VDRFQQKIQEPAKNKRLHDVFAVKLSFYILGNRSIVSRGEVRAGAADERAFFACKCEAAKESYKKIGGWIISAQNGEEQR
jgi:hypothetical protein